MKLNILEEKKNKLVFEIHGQSHGFANALKEELRKDKTVKNAGYYVKHPLEGVPTFHVETSGGDAKTALKKAAKGLVSKADKIKKEASKIK